MKNRIKYIFVCIVTFLMINCAVKKNILPQNDTVENTSKKNKTINKEYIIDESKVGFNLFDDTKPEKKWVDSIYSNMSFDEKLGQLFMIAGYSNRDSVHFNAVDKLVKEYKVGGIIFF